MPSNSGGRGVAEPCDGMGGDDQPLAAPGETAGGCDEALADCDGPPWRRGSETQNQNEMEVKTEKLACHEIQTMR